MALTITHDTVATLPDDPEVEIGAGEWNENHAISGSIAWDEIDEKPATFPPDAHNHDGDYDPIGTASGLVGDLSDALADTTPASEGARLVGFQSDDTVHDTIVDILNRGLLHGFVITNTSGLNVTWTDGDIWDPASDTIIEVSAQVAPTACTDNAINYLKWTGGTTLTLSTVDASGDQVLVARLDCFDGVIHTIRQNEFLSTVVSSTRRSLRLMFPVVVLSGMVVSAKAGVGTWDVISSIGGHIEDGHAYIPAIAVDSTVTQMMRVFHVSGVWDHDHSSEIDPTKWDNGTNLVAVSASKWYKSLFLLGDDMIHWVYPQAEYSNEAQAIAGPLPTVPAGLARHVKSTAVVLRGNAANFPTAGSNDWIDVRPLLTGSAFGPITDHGALAGLEDDDHTQYHTDGRGDLRYSPIALSNGISGTATYLPKFTGVQSLGNSIITEIAGYIVVNDGYLTVRKDVAGVPSVIELMNISSPVANQGAQVGFWAMTDTEPATLVNVAAIGGILTALGGTKPGAMVFKTHTPESGGAAPVEHMRLTSTGLGVLNNNPQYALDVTGSVRISASMSVGAPNPDAACRLYSYNVTGNGANQWVGLFGNDEASLGNHGVAIRAGNTGTATDYALKVTDRSNTPLFYVTADKKVKFNASTIIGFGNSDEGVTGTSSPGITWVEDSGNFGIYKSAGAWAGPDYQQLKLVFATGIVLNGGSSAGKSGIQLQPDGGNVWIGPQYQAPAHRLSIVNEHNGVSARTCLCLVNLEQTALNFGIAMAAGRYGNLTDRPIQVYDSTSTYPLMQLNGAGDLSLASISRGARLNVSGARSDPSLAANSACIAQFGTPSWVDLAISGQEGSPYGISLQARHYSANNLAYPLSLNPLGGNIGIGTSAPTDMLHVYSRTGSSSYVLIDNPITTYNTGIVTRNIGTHATACYWIQYIPGESYEYRFFCNGADRLALAEAEVRIGAASGGLGGYLIIQGNASSSYQLFLHNGTTAYGYKIGREVTLGALEFYGTQTGYGHFKFSNVDGYFTTISNLGWVGIGLGNAEAASPLQVKGPSNGSATVVIQNVTVDDPCLRLGLVDYHYSFKRATYGYMHVTGSQAGYTGYCFNGPMVVGSASALMNAIESNCSFQVIDVVGSTNLLIQEASAATNNAAALRLACGAITAYQADTDWLIQALGHDYDHRLRIYHNAAYQSGEKVSILQNGNVGLGVVDPDEQLELTGRLHLGQIAAPVTTTDKLYNVAGVLTWNAIALHGSNTHAQIDTFIASATATPTASKIPIADANGYLDGWVSPIATGWISAGETWTYASNDSPTYTLTVPTDLTGKYQAGQRVKLTQTTVKYFIITKVAYSSPNTTLTLYGGTDYTLADAAISANFYSREKIPFGFPLDHEKWTVLITDTTTRSQASPAQNTWYNIGTTNAQIIVPIGKWHLSYNVAAYADGASTQPSTLCATLSTANNSESDSTMTGRVHVGTTNTNLVAMIYRERYLDVTTKTTYYLNGMARTNPTDNIYWMNTAGDGPMILKAVCAYL